MTRSEAEEIFISAVMKDQIVAVEMTAQECQVFRVLVGRAIKEMEKANRPLWLKARDYGIEYNAEQHLTLIKKQNANRFKMYTVDNNGIMTPITKVSEKEETSNFDTTE